MSHTPHELSEEFPAEAEKIHNLKASNAHFARLVDEYHTVNRAVHRAETRAEVMAEDQEHELRRTRSQLKDRIWSELKRV